MPTAPSSFRWSLAVEADAIRVESSGHHVPDPDWVETDKAGHVHRFVGSDIPTAEWVVVRTYWCSSCCDEHDDYEVRCRECGATLSPVYGWSGPTARSIPGRTHYILTVDDERYEVTEQQALHAHEKGEDGVREVLAEIAARGS